MPEQMKTLVIVPAFNEEGSLPDLLDELRSYRDRYDVLVVDDGSRDNSAQIARERRVPVVQLPANLGIGGAVQTGFKYAVAKNYDIAVQLDGDGQHDPAWLDLVIAPILQGEANCVIGSRYLRESFDREYRTPFFRRIGMIFSSFVLFMATGKWITDTTSGFRALDRKTLMYFSTEYPIDHPEAEALLMLFQKGFAIKEVPVKMRSRQAGTSLFTWVKAIKYPVRVLIGFLGLLIQRKR
jgi:glycosyltransferase involved in cell wall biosynthesis